MPVYENINRLVAPVFKPKKTARPLSGDCAADFSVINELQIELHNDSGIITENLKNTRTFYQYPEIFFPGGQPQSIFCFGPEKITGKKIKGFLFSLRLTVEHGQ
jgi:hypothetical protein